MIFFFISIVVLPSIYGYIGWRLIVPAALGVPVKLFLWGILILLLTLPFIPISIISGIMRISGVEGSWVDAFGWAGYLSFGFFTILFAVILTRDLILLLTVGVQKSIHLARHVFGSGNPAAETVDPERRRLLLNSINLGILGITGAMTGYGMFEALRKPDIVEITIPIENLPEDLDGFRIVQIADIHVSHTIKRRFVQTVVDQVKELRPDLVALTGDLVDGSVAQLRDDVAPLTDPDAPYGNFFITGNHEYYSGVRQWLEEVSRLGFDVLLNEHRIIERGAGRLLLAGVTDYSGGRFGEDHISDPVKAMSGAPDCHARILLAHQPKSIFAAAKAGYDYVISGHTHGGQYFPYHFLAALTQPYISGFYNHDGTRIYISRGTGYWGPQIRIGARSEITVHKLTAA